MKLLHSYLTFGQGRFWKKIKLYINFEILGLLFFFRFFNGLAAHLNMNQFRRNFTESIFLWNGTFHITDQHIFFALMAKKHVFNIFNVSFSLIKAEFFMDFAINIHLYYSNMLTYSLIFLAKSNDKDSHFSI